MRLLVICPTRGRPKIFKRMLESFEDTITTDVKLIAGVDLDDQTFPQYPTMRHKYFICENQTVTEIINEIYRKHPGYDFYSVTNDDFVYHTKGWDKELMQKGKVSYPNDLSGGKLPTTSVICADILNALGWLQMPALTHLYGDVVWRYIGQKLNILNYRDDIIVEHRHFIVGKECKSFYEKSNSKEMYARDQQAFRSWVSNKSKEEIESVRLALSGMQQARALAQG